MTTSTNNSQMHNNIMATGSKDIPPLLAPWRYQWHSCFLRYVDTKSNKNKLKQCIFHGPYVMTEVTILAKPATTTEQVVAAHNVPETYENTTLEKRVYIDAEAEAINMILSRIGDDIYSIVDACTTVKEMWIAIERFYKMMNEMVRNQLEVTTMQVNVQFLQQLQPEWLRFVMYLNEVNEIYAEKIARNANPLALVAPAQHYPDNHYQAPKSYKNYAPSSKPTPSTRSYATNKNKGKEIAKPVTPPYEPAFKEEEEEDSDPKHAQRDKDMEKNLALIAKYIKNIYKPTNNNLRTS
ncbi:hypothetical protein Tco_0643770 [Tanacetum coccineum]